MRRRGRHRPTRVPVPGIPPWAAHAEVARVSAAGAPVKLRPIVRVHHARYGAWWVGCKVGHATLEFWRSLYVREDPHPHINAGPGGLAPSHGGRRYGNVRIMRRR